MICKKCVNGIVCGGEIVDYLEKDKNNQDIVIEVCSKCKKIRCLDPVILTPNFPGQRALSDEIFPSRNHLQYRLA